MSNTDPTVEELQAEIDRLNSELGNRTNAPAAGGTTTGGTASTQNVQPTSGPGINRETGSDAKVIGGEADPRGGAVIAYSDGTVKLFGAATVGPDNQPAEGWGSVPEGEYVSFFTTNNGDTYNFVTADGMVESVTNPVITQQPGSPPITT